MAKKRPPTRKPVNVDDFVKQLRAMNTQLGHALNGGKREVSDFTAYYKPTDDPFSSATGGTSDGSRPDLNDMWMLLEHRIGIAEKIASEPAKIAVHNRFQFVETGTENVVQMPKIFKTYKKIDFWNQLASAMRYERGLGTSYWIQYFKKDLTDDLKTAPPKLTPPTRIMTLSAMHFTPVDVHETKTVDYDPDVWKFRGGKLASFEVHKDRVHVWRTRPMLDDYRGLSLFEPIWFPLCSYMNTMINVMKAIAKWGDVVPVVKMGPSSPDAKTVTSFADLITEYKALGAFLVGREDDVTFDHPQLGAGLNDYIEFIKEDISAGVSIPLNILFGRSESGGIGGEGALVAERGYLQTVGGIQDSISDDIMALNMQWGFDVEDLDLLWALSLQKTKEQKLKEDAMNEQLIQLKINTQMLRLQKRQLAVQVKMAEATASAQTAQMLAPQFGIGADEGNGKTKPTNDFLRELWEENRESVVPVPANYLHGRFQQMLDSSEKIFKNIMGVVK